MQRPIHTRYFNYIYAVALLLIVVIFGMVGYFLVNSTSLVNQGFNALSMVVFMAVGIGLLAVLTGVFFLVTQLDTRLARPADEPDFVVSDEDEPDNYGAPRN